MRIEVNMNDSKKEREFRVKKRRNTSKKRKQKVSKKRQKNLPKKRKKRRFDWTWLLYLAALVIGIYPFVSNLYYTHIQNQVSDAYYQQTKRLDPAVLAKQKKETAIYNQDLADEFAQQLVMPEFNISPLTILEGKGSNLLDQVIGVLYIPQLTLEVPIYSGTTDEQLKNGVGLLAGSSLPYGGPSTHSVITGHRGLPTAKLFTDLPQLDIGDDFYIQSLDEVLAYEVDQIKVVEPEEVEDLKIEKNQDYVTLLTCTPYMVNSHRLLVRGIRVPLDEEKWLEGKTKAKLDYWLELLFYLALVVLISLIIYGIKRLIKRGRK